MHQDGVDAGVTGTSKSGIWWPKVSGGTWYGRIWVSFLWCRYPVPMSHIQRTVKAMQLPGKTFSLAHLTPPHTIMYAHMLLTSGYLNSKNSSWVKVTINAVVITFLCLFLHCIWSCMWTCTPACMHTQMHTHIITQTIHKDAQEIAGQRVTYWRPMYKPFQLLQLNTKHITIIISIAISQECRNSPGITKNLIWLLAST